jgi:hypothetical protein
MNRNRFGISAGFNEARWLGMIEIAEFSHQTGKQVIVRWVLISTTPMLLKISPMSARAKPRVVSIYLCLPPYLGIVKLTGQ